MSFFSQSHTSTFSSSAQKQRNSSTEIEIKGTVSKKTSKGFYTVRYFATVGANLCYWNNESESVYHYPKQSYLISEITSIEKLTSRAMFIIFSANLKFKIEIKFSGDAECQAWFELLSAKRALYSNHELLVELEEGVQFNTQFFAKLMVMKEKEQNEFILEKIDDVFEAAADVARTNTLRADSATIISASRTCVEDLILTCDECLREMESRNPKLMAHCRDFMHRYASVIKGRITMELAFVLNAEGKKRAMSDMGEAALCKSISLINRLDYLRHYTFLPHDLVPTLNNSIFSVGMLFLKVFFPISSQKYYLTSKNKIKNNNNPRRINGCIAKLGNRKNGWVAHLVFRDVPCAKGWETWRSRPSVVGLSSPYRVSRRRGSRGLEENHV